MKLGGHDSSVLVIDLDYRFNVHRLLDRMQSRVFMTLCAQQNLEATKGLLLLFVCLLSCNAHCCVLCFMCFI